MSALSVVTELAIIDTSYDVVPSADVLAAAYDAVTLTGEASATASGTLASVTLARYAFHAAKFTVTRKGRAILTAARAKEVSMMLWCDATGSLIAPKGDERKGACVSFGQYISHYGKVAQSLDHGTAHLATVATAKAGYKAILATNKAAKDRIDMAKLALQDIADAEVFAQWLSAQKQELQTAFAHVATALRGDASPHLSAFVASVTFASTEVTF